jgi:hypothetical protein
VHAAIHIEAIHQIEETPSKIEGGIFGLVLWNGARFFESTCACTAARSDEMRVRVKYD